MIKLKWSIFSDSKAVSFEVYVSFIGFLFPTVALNNKTLVISVDGREPECIIFDGTDAGQKLSKVKGLSVSEHTGHTYVRAQKSINIISGTAMPLLWLQKETIVEKSRKFQIANVEKSGDSILDFSYDDPHGLSTDYYGIVCVYPDGAKSDMCAMRRPIDATGPICVIEGIITNSQGARVCDVAVTANIYKIPEALNGTMITKEPIKVYTSEDGRYSLPLLQGLIVKIEIDSIGYGKLIEVPKTQYAMLAELKEWEDDV